MLKIVLLKFKTKNLERFFYSQKTKFTLSHMGKNIDYMQQYIKIFRMKN